MGWITLALLGAGAMAAMAALRIDRGLWSFVGAALMLGAAGYALQGRPMLLAHDAVSNPKPPSDDADVNELRDRMLGKFTADGAYQVAADAMTRSGDKRAAVQVILAGLHRAPESTLLWTGLGTALAAHDNDVVSPPALFAFREATRLSPRHPAPPFFEGLAYVRAGDFATARPLWARALRLIPDGVSYRKDIALRLALLDRYQALQQAAAREQRQ